VSSGYFKQVGHNVGCKMNNRSDIEFLNDLDRGNYDCQRGETVREDESEAYYIGYGARYVLEQSQSAGSK
jgi:hypothetical protein